MTCLRGQLSQRSPELARAEAEAITAASGHIVILIEKKRAIWILEAPKKLRRW